MNPAQEMKDNQYAKTEKMEQSLFEKIDKALGGYYKSFGKNNYSNEDGIGKFLEFCEVNDFQEEDIDEELGHDAAAEDCLYLESVMDSFPFKNEMKNENEKQNFIFNKLKQFYNESKMSLKQKETLNDDDYIEEPENNQKQQPLITQRTQAIPKSKIDPTIKRICDALGKYYKTIKNPPAPYNCLFSNYCCESYVYLIFVDY